MKELDRIRSNNSDQLGSLEDTMPVKRIDPSQIRRLRAKTHEQANIRFSLMRFFATTWSQFQSNIALLFIPSSSVCVRDGHVPELSASGEMHCRHCKKQIASVEELMKLDS